MQVSCVRFLQERFTRRFYAIMRKKIIIITSLLLILLLGSCVYWFGFSDAYQSNTSEWSGDITISDGKVDPQMSHETFQIEEDGNYHLSIKYLPEGSSLKSLEKHPESAPAFIAGCVITDEQGRLQYAISGRYFTVDTSNDITAGTYNLDFYYFTNREDYVEFAKAYLCGSAMAENYADGIDFPSPSNAAESSIEQDTWTMKYALGFSSSSTLRSSQGIAMLFVFLTSLCLVVLILSLITKGPSWRERYDERQELERGRGFKYAYFTMLIYFLVMVFVDAARLPLAADTSLLYFCGMLLGILVYMVYCVWHESYFALNQNMHTVMIALGLIGLSNFLISLFNLFNGTLVENGRLTFRIMNLLCSFLFFALFLTILLKKMVSSKGGSADEEEDKE